MRFKYVAVVGFLVFPAVSLRAQEIATLREGQRVRLTSASHKELVGVVKQARADSIVVFRDPSGAQLAIATSDLRKVDVSRGRSASEGAKRGAFWGGAVGAGLAVLGTILIGSADDTDFTNENFAVAEFAANMIAGGAVWGAGIGTFVKAERWDRTAIQPRVAKSGVGVSIASR